MATWVSVDWDELNQPRHEKLNGVDVTVFFSPYDMPEAISGEYDAARKRFVIRFKYLGGIEPLRLQQTDEHFVLGIGETTGRMHEIEIDVDSLKADCVELHTSCDRIVDDVRETLQGLSATSGSTSNYMAASGAIDQQRVNVAEGLARALCSN